MIVGLRVRIPADAEVELAVGDEVPFGNGPAGTIVAMEVRRDWLILEVEIDDDHPVARALVSHDTLRVSEIPLYRSSSTWNPSGGRRMIDG